MQTFINALSGTTAADLWAAILPIVPIVGIGILVSFGYVVLKWALSHLSFYGGNVRDTVSNYRHRND